MDFSFVFFIPIAAVMVMSAVRGFEPRERRFALLALVVHVIAAFVHWGISETVYFGSDIYGYVEHGAQLARLLDLDFLRFAPELLKLALHMDTDLPFEVVGAGGSTGTINALAGLMGFVAGRSMIALCLVTTCGSWFGQVCLYRVARDELPAASRPPAAVGFFLVPSVLFWGGGLTKEGLVMGFFGVLVLSTYRLLKDRAVLHVAGVAMGGVGVGMLKPYILFGYVVAVAAALYADRAWRDGGPIRIRPAYLCLAGGLAVGGLLAMGTLFPQFEASSIAETLAGHQGNWESQDASGSIAMVGSSAARSIPQQAAFVPIALVNVLLRPAIFEAKNATMLLAAAESTLIAVGFFSIFRRRSRAGSVEMLLRSPLLVFCVVFVLTFGTGVGLATSNMGALSRYRIPMMPFYVATLLVLRARNREAANIPARGRATRFQPRTRSV
jgi:hypothetical protein